MNYRDLAERLWWTLVAAFLGALTVSDLLDISAIDAALSATAAAGVNFLLVVARARLAILPDPGAGLPGLPTEDVVNNRGLSFTDTADSSGIPWDDEHTTPDAGAVNWQTVALVTIAVVAVLLAFGQLPLDL